LKVLKEAIAAVAKAVGDEITNLIPCQQGALSNLSDSMRHSALGGGKCLRPFLLVKSADLFDVPQAQSLRVGAAVELVHCYSLVHDDLPAMDDDDLRRGRPTNHRIFGEATAILAGSALLTLAFEALNRPDRHIDPEIRSKLSENLARAAGMVGMIGGQILDLSAEDHSLDDSETARLQRLKTGSLFEFSAEAGALLGSATAEEISALIEYARALGLAFQITDDLLDIEGSVEKIGKGIQKDMAAGKATFVSLLGADGARSKAKALVDQSIEHLYHFDDRAKELRQLAKFVLSRSH